MTVIQDQLDFIRSLNSFLQRLGSNPRAAFVGFRNVLAFAVLYEIALLLWPFGAEGITLPAFLRIPEEQYYFYELIFLVPLFLCIWLLASEIDYLISKAIGGNGTYDAILGGFGLTMAVSAYFTLIPDCVQGVLWSSGSVSFAEYQGLTSRELLLIIVWTYLLSYFLAHPLI